MTNLSFAKVFSPILLALALVSCGPNETGLAIVAADYTAIVMQTTPTTTGSTTTNLLGAGATMNINLKEDKSTTGQLHIPAINGQPALDASMAGTWRLDGIDVTFQQAADTFVRNMTWVVQGNLLIGDQVFSGVRVQVTLARP